MIHWPPENKDKVRRARRDEQQGAVAASVGERWASSSWWGTCEIRTGEMNDYWAFPPSLESVLEWNIWCRPRLTVLVRVSYVKRKVTANGRWTGAFGRKSSSTVAFNVQCTGLNRWLQSLCSETAWILTEIPPVLVEGRILFQTGTSNSENCCGCFFGEGGKGFGGSHSARLGEKGSLFILSNLKSTGWRSSQEWNMFNVIHLSWGVDKSSQNPPWLSGEREDDVESFTPENICTAALKHKKYSKQLLRAPRS